MLTTLPKTDEIEVFFVRSIQGEYQLNSLVTLRAENRFTSSLSSSTSDVIVVHVTVKKCE
jgi:hypothetical protein